MMALIAIVAGAAIVLVTGWLLYSGRGSVEDREARRLVKERRNSLRRVTKEHDRAVRRAARVLAAAQRDYADAVSAAEKSLSIATWPKLIHSMAGITLTEDSIRTPQGTAPLGPGVTATVDTAGNLAMTKRVTLTRLVGLGLIGGLIFQKKQRVDTRELYLLVETPEFASIVQCRPDKGPQVRRFAVQINNAARGAKAARAARRQMIAAAQARLEAVTADRRAIEEAEAALAGVRSDRAAIEAAEAQLQLPPGGAVPPTATEQRSSPEAGAGSSSPAEADDPRS